MGVACVDSVLPAVAPSASGVSSPCPLASRAAAAVHARRTVSPMHDVNAQNSWSDTGSFQGPRGRKRVKGGVSGPAEDLRPVSEVAAGVNFRPAGGAREQVAGSLPRRQPGTGPRRVREGVVTPSFHPEVLDSLFVSPGPGKRIRQSGIWVLKGNTRTCMFLANLDHLRVGWRKLGSYETAWVTPGHDCLCSYAYGHGDHKLIRPSGMELLGCGAGSRPSYHLGVVRRNCQRG